jgi:hypothetical protein
LPNGNTYLYCDADGDAHGYALSRCVSDRDSYRYVDSVEYAVQRCLSDGHVHGNADGDVHSMR